MSAIVLSGTELSKKVKENVAKEVESLKQKGLHAGLAVIIVEGDAASRVYVNAKKKDCEECGIKSFEYELPNNTTEQELLDLVEQLNNNDEVHGILCQLPLPKHIDETKILNAIAPHKDADCFHPFNVGLLTTGMPSFQPCTPSGVMQLLELTGVDIAGKSCVVIGRSNIVGKPMGLMLLAKNGTVTICHSKTTDIKERCLNADIIVAAVGRANFVTEDMVKPGAIVIDVGVSRTADNKLVGDVEFETVKEKASYITKVVGGVGPMTRAVLMQNTLTAAKNAFEKK